MPRCPNGSRKNKQGICECKVGWIKYKSSCVPKLTPNVKQVVKRCPTGSRKNKNRICECKDKTKILHKNVCINKQSKSKSKSKSPIKSAEEIFNSPSPEPPPEPPFEPQLEPLQKPKEHKENEQNNQNVVGRFNVKPGRYNETNRLSYQKQKAATKIQSSMITYVMNKLSKICPNVSDCLLIGKYRPYILKWFNHFNLKSADDNVKRIGLISNNAIILELKFNVNIIVEDYKRYHYTSYAILKSNLFSYTDNLWYEYKVGKYLNAFHKFLPMFVETYNLYKYIDRDLKEMLFMRDNPSFNIHQMTGKHIHEILIEANDTTLMESCNQSENYAFTSQIIQNSFSLFDLIGKSKINNYDLASVIFQVYFGICTLNMNGHPFAHYDLHTGNVLLYKPFGDNMIHYRFHYSETGEIRDIYTPYMIKMIDYGRSFIKDTPDIFNELSKQEYKKPCGRDHGVDRGFFQGKYIREDIFVSYTDVNLSHDLRLLENIREINSKHKYYSSLDIEPIFKKLIYNVGIKKKQYMTYGTQPNNTRGGLVSINNIWDVPDNFWEYIQQHQRNPSNIKARIDIYDDLRTPLALVIN